MKLVLNSKIFNYPEGELWLAYELFYENLKTGLTEKYIILNKDEKPQFHGVEILKMR